MSILVNIGKLFQQWTRIMFSSHIKDNKLMLKIYVRHILVTFRSSENVCFPKRRF